MFVDAERIPICLSLELPWRENAKNISCIPLGIYTCSPEWNSDYGRHIYRVHNVPDRSGILIHPYNLVSEARGCIAPGMAFDPVKGYPGVTGSGVSLDELYHAAKESAFRLSVERAF